MQCRLGEHILHLKLKLKEIPYGKRKDQMKRKKIK